MSQHSYLGKEIVMLMHKRVWGIGVFGLLILLCPVSSIAEDSVTWMEAKVPPIYIHEGENKGQGYEDVITDIIMENLDGYESHEIIASVARMYEELRRGEKVCNVAFFKTPEREEFMYFSSLPTTFTLPNMIITKKSKAELFGGTKTVKLEDILKDGKLTLAADKARSYGKNIDAVLQRYKGQKNLLIHAGEAVSEGLLKMLLADRLDGVLGLPEEAMFLAEELNAENELITIALDENKGNYDAWVAYVACSKTEWGKQILEKIDHILSEQRATERYRAAYERWLDENSIESYRKLYDDVFLKMGK